MRISFRYNIHNVLSFYDVGPILIREILKLQFRGIILKRKKKYILNESNCRGTT